MRMIPAIALLLLPSGALLATPASTPIPGAAANLRLLQCPGAPVAGWAGQPPAKPGARKLGDLPPGKLIHTVYREVDGCPEEAVLRTNIGATSFEPALRRR